jgi:hypothetical protein
MLRPHLYTSYQNPNLVDCRFFVDFAVDFSSDFSGKREGFVQNGLKIFKFFCQSQQSTTWPIRDAATVDFSRER